MIVGYTDKVNPIFTARKRSCGKVMFLHLCVILFTGGVSVLAGLCLGGSLSGGPTLSMGSLCPGVSLSRESLTVGSPSRGISVWRSLSKGRLCPRGVPVQGGLCPRGVSCPGESLSRQVWGCVSLSGCCFLGGLCPGESLSRQVSGRSLSGGTVKGRRYASYWNAFLFAKSFMQ